MSAAVELRIANDLAALVEIAQRQGLNSAGTYSCGAHFEALFNSHGVARTGNQLRVDVDLISN